MGTACPQMASRTCLSFPCYYQVSNHQAAVPVLTETLVKQATTAMEATTLHLLEFLAAALLLVSHMLRAVKGRPLQVQHFLRPHEMATTTVPHKTGDPQSHVIHCDVMSGQCAVASLAPVPLLHTNIRCTFFALLFFFHTFINNDTIIFTPFPFLGSDYAAHFIQYWSQGRRVLARGTDLAASLMNVLLTLPQA